MAELLASLISFVIAVLGFSYGALRLFHKGRPLYFQLLVCAAGCFALRQLSAAVGYLCGMNDVVTVGVLGFFGCNFFLLSANYGQLDRIVDDGSAANQLAKRLAFFAPVLLAICMALIFAAWRSNLFAAVIFAVVMLPALPAAYFNLKHLTLPVDDFGFLRATRPCNIAALIYEFVTAAALYASAFENSAVAGAAEIVMSLALLWLVLSAEKGANAWKI